MLTRFDDMDRTFAFMDQLRRRMDRLFDDYDSPRLALRSNLADEVERAWSRGRFPRMTLSDTAAQLVLTAELPGLSEKDVELSIQKDVLTLRGARKQDAPQGYFVHRQERAPFEFAKSFALPAKVDPEKSTATLKDGVLTITLPKIPEAQPRQIAVKAQ